MKPRFIPFYVLMFACIVNCNGSPTSTHPVKLSAPRLIAPNSNAKGVARPPHFRWKGVSGAKIYDLVIRHHNKKIFHKRVRGTHLTPNGVWLSNTNYHWRVRAIVNGDEGKWSKPLRFTTGTKIDSSAAAKPGIPKQLLPKDKEKDAPLKPRFKWKEVAGADKYELQVSSGHQIELQKQVKSTTFTPDRTSPEKTTFSWRVRAIKNGIKGQWSGVHFFTTRAANTIARSETVPDRKALMILYKTTDGKNWTHNKGWGSKKPLSSWYGIKANPKGRVIRIDLWHNNLTGNIEKVPWASLDKVKYLNIKYNHLTGSIPPTIGGMSSLRVLILQGRNYKIGGTLKEPPIDDWRRGYHAGKHYSNTNDFHGPIPPEFGNLSNLVALEITNAKHVKGPIPDEIGKLTNLKGLYLSGDDFRGTTLPASICNLTDLRQIQIEGTGIGGKIPKCFSKLTKLTDINFSRFDHNHTYENHLTGEIPDFSQMTDLRRILFSNNKLSGEFPHYWNNGNFPHLVTINFAANNLTGTLPRFDNLQNLIFFSIQNNNMSGSINSVVNVPSRIKILNIGGNNFSGKFPQSGWPDFYQLKSVHINDNNLTGDIPCSFWRKLDNPELAVAAFGREDFDSMCPDGAHKVEEKRGINITGI